MLKSRKKMLLSSIAMLLVALVALGSATFAWYASIDLVTAEQTQFKASTSEGLVIRHYKDATEYASTNSDFATQTAWKTALNEANGNALKSVATLVPASITYEQLNQVRGAYGISNNRESAALYGKLTGEDNATTLADTTHFLVDQMYVAGESGAKNVDFTIKASGDALNKSTGNKSYLVVAVYVGNDLAKVFTSDNTIAGTGADKGTKKVLYDATDAEEPYKESAADAQKLTSLTCNDTYDTVQTNFTVQSKDSNGTKITIIAFADGCNPNCKTSTVETSELHLDYKFSIAS